MSVSHQLVSFATKRAAQCAQIDQMKHDAQGRGENLAQMPFSYRPPAPVDCEAMVKVWYDEIKYYDYNNVQGSTSGYNFEKVGHYTQLVWNRSRRIGCGQAASKRNVFTACNYDPPGNVRTQYELNVARPIHRVVSSAYSKYSWSRTQG